MRIATSLKLNRLEPDDLSIEPPHSNICRRAPHKVLVLSFMEDLSLFAMLTITANTLALAKDDLAINLTIGPRLPRPLRLGRLRVPSRARAQRARPRRSRDRFAPCHGG
ncbi:hypothetical protein CLIM01_10967 [Colletotrichum limetticola]|uniref:Uncharacterized protein n=1 Tax=Colletotrichum limetticola TaxID=1209924 RepID=A0ABQ9PHZ7_9PEZI|nr:hypothetical protein CLIM01_10967 [Colletotrichum limetticola]